MADVELAIKIPEELFSKIDDENYQSVISWYDTTLYRAIKDGTVLPKGHGRLIDEQNISDYVHSHIQEINTGYGDLNSHTNRILRMVESYIDKAPTIIESDKEDK